MTTLIIKNNYLCMTVEWRKYDDNETGDTEMSVWSNILHETNTAYYSVTSRCYIAHTSAVMVTVQIGSVT